VTAAPAFRCRPTIAVGATQGFGRHWARTIPGFQASVAPTVGLEALARPPRSCLTCTTTLTARPRKGALEGFTPVATVRGRPSTFGATVRALPPALGQNWDTPLADGYVDHDLKGPIRAKSLLPQPPCFGLHSAAPFPSFLVAVAPKVPQTCPPGLLSLTPTTYCPSRHTHLTYCETHLGSRRRPLVVAAACRRPSFRFGPACSAWARLGFASEVPLVGLLLASRLAPQPLVLTLGGVPLSCSAAPSPCSVPSVRFGMMPCPKALLLRLVLLAVHLDSPCHRHGSGLVCR
jgi:hypothetical protein